MRHCVDAPIQKTLPRSLGSSINSRLLLCIPPPPHITLHTFHSLQAPTTQSSLFSQICVLQGRVCFTNLESRTLIKHTWEIRQKHFVFEMFLAYFRKTFLSMFSENIDFNPFYEFSMCFLCVFHEFSMCFQRVFFAIFF